jgi:hypothetical protein
MAAAPVIITYIIEREWVLNSCACSLITTNSLPRILVIIIGLKTLTTKQNAQESCNYNNKYLILQL